MLEFNLAWRCAWHQEEPWIRPDMEQARWLVRDNLKTNPITIKPEKASQVVPLPCCSWLGRPFSIKSFLKYKFIYFNWRLITTLYWFCHTSTWIRHGYTRVPHPEPPSHLSPCTIPLGHPSAPAPSILYHASNLDWRFVSYMILYMFQCHSPKSSHPLPLPQSPKDCSIHLCLFCCLAGHTHRGNQNWKRHVYPNVHRSTVYNSQDMEAT